MSIRTVHHRQTRTRYSTHQMMELGFNRLHIGENIGVIVFEIIQNHRAWVVMHEFGTLVEKRRIVFIRLHHKKRRFAQTRRHTKVFRHATDQKARF